MEKRAKWATSRERDATRRCVVPACTAFASATLRVDPVAPVAWLVDLDRSSGGDDLCGRHANALCASSGWTLHDERRAGAVAQPSVDAARRRPVSFSPEVALPRPPLDTSRTGEAPAPDEASDPPDDPPERGRDIDLRRAGSERPQPAVGTTDGAAAPITEPGTEPAVQPVVAPAVEAIADPEPAPVADSVTEPPGDPVGEAGGGPAAEALVDPVVVKAPLAVDVAADLLPGQPPDPDAPAEPPAPERDILDARSPLLRRAFSKSRRS
jgi:hypothetical protein